MTWRTRLALLALVGALGALAIGIGTSEVEHVLATQTLPQIKPKTMAVEVNGRLPARNGSCDQHPFPLDNLLD